MNTLKIIGLCILGLCCLFHPVGWVIIIAFIIYNSSSTTYENKEPKKNDPYGDDGWYE